MTEIQTKVSVLYDARENKSGKIIIRLETAPTTDGYNAVITDFVERTVENEGEVSGVYQERIRSKNLYISKEQINMLFGMVSAQIPSGIPYFEREKELFKYAFLVFVQNDFLKDAAGNPIAGKTIYNLNPSDWEIKN